MDCTLKLRDKGDEGHRQRVRDTIGGRGRVVVLRKTITYMKEWS